MTFPKDLFSLQGNAFDFELVALQAYSYQMEHNELYRNFVKLLKREVNEFKDIPFLPISFFKNHKILTHGQEVEKTFLSSATSGSTRSQHLVAKLEIYRKSFLTNFEQEFGNLEDWTILSLLPSYLEQGDSSLIYMVQELMVRASDDSSFWLQNPTELPKTIGNLLDAKRKVMLFGVSYALLDLAESGPFSFDELHIMETGGMKGRKKEMIRTELHAELHKGFGTQKIHSEYGMTELLSQAYSISGSNFRCPPWMRVQIRQTDDPLSAAKLGSIGGINVIDLANWYSCPFIATNDLGRMNSKGEFEVLGRFDHSDVRGCNLLIA